MQLCSICLLTLPAVVISQAADRETDVLNSPTSSSSIKQWIRGWRSTGVYVICIAGIASIVEVIMIVLRFLNIGAINLHMKVFFIIVSAN